MAILNHLRFFLMMIATTTMAMTTSNTTTTIMIIIALSLLGSVPWNWVVDTVPEKNFFKKETSKRSNSTDRLVDLGICKILKIDITQRVNHWELPVIIHTITTGNYWYSLDIIFINKGIKFQYCNYDCTFLESDVYWNFQILNLPSIKQNVWWKLSDEVTHSLILNWYFQQTAW